MQAVIPVLIKAHDTIMEMKTPMILGTSKMIVHSYNGSLRNIETINLQTNGA
jgi:hypothetical protein